MLLNNQKHASSHDYSVSGGGAGLCAAHGLVSKPLLYKDLTFLHRVSVGHSIQTRWKATDNDFAKVD